MKIDGTTEDNGLSRGLQDACKQAALPKPRHVHAGIGFGELLCWAETQDRVWGYQSLERIT